MSDHYFNFNGGRGIISVGNGYKFGGFYFEWNNYLGPTKMNKNGEPSKQQGRKFFNMIDRWVKLTDKEKEKTRIYD